MSMVLWVNSSRAAPVPSMYLYWYRANTSMFDDIGISQVCYTNTNSVVCALLSINCFFLLKVVKLK